MTVRHNQRGYVGSSRSVRAVEAERDGRFPLTHAKKIVAEKFGCSSTVAAAALKLLHDGEWHHSSKYANRVDYYDYTDERLGGAIRHIVACGGAAKWTARREAVRKTRLNNPRPGGGLFNNQWNVRRAKMRRAARIVAAEVLGREPNAAYPVGLWPTLARLTNDAGELPQGDLAIIAVARAAGWSDDAIVLALADAGDSVERITRAITT